MSADVIIIGAGLAGLSAARELANAGVPTLILEASENVGGRLRTEVVDGFRLDRGFQVLNPAYPALQEAVDIAALRIRPFGRGVAVRSGSSLRVVTDPSRAPWRAASLLRLASRDPIGSTGLAAWATPALGGQKILTRMADTTLTESLDEVHARGPLREEVFEPFLSGVLGDDTGASSAIFARWLTRWFALATPGLPERGMAALPTLMRKGLDAEVRFGTHATGLAREGSGWRVQTHDESLLARGVVVATDPPTATKLCGTSAAPMRGLATWWFATEDPPTHSSCLHVDGRREGPVVNTAVISNAQPSYAPAGRHLIQASTLLSGPAPTETEVRRHVGEIYGCSAARWDVVGVHLLPAALSAIDPGRAFAPSYAEAGLIVAGDAGDASIQGALASGTAAGQQLAQDLSPRVAR